MTQTYEHLANDIKIDIEEHCRDLGVTMCSDLTFDKHTNSIVDKAKNKAQ